MCVFGGCESGMNLPPSGQSNYQNITTSWQNSDEYNAWLRLAATDVNAKKHHKKEHPSWWLSQTDIDRLEPAKPTRWQKIIRWWRNK